MDRAKYCGQQMGLLELGADGQRRLGSAGVTAFTGQMTCYRFNHAPGPCLRCLYPREPDERAAATSARSPGSEPRPPDE